MNFFKITEKMLESINENVENENIILSKLPICIKDPINIDAGVVVFEKLCSICDCESPIEQMLALQMYDMQITNCEYFIPNLEIPEIRNQAHIEEVNCIVDFLIPVCIMNKQIMKYFVIECDGHEFHEKTKEQVRKDKQRERKLIEAGYTVIRFTGSEIYKSPCECVKQILNIIIANSK